MWISVRETKRDMFEHNDGGDNRRARESDDCNGECILQALLEDLMMVRLGDEERDESYRTGTTA